MRGMASAVAAGGMRAVPLRLAKLYPQTRWWDTDVGWSGTSWTDRCKADSVPKGAAGPTMGASLNGHQGLTYVAANSQVLDQSSSALAALLSGTAKWTIAFMAQFSAAGAFKVAAGAGRTVSTTATISAGQHTTGVARVTRLATSPLGTGALGTTRHRIAAEFDGANVRILVDGVSQASVANASSLVTLDRFLIGAGLVSAVVGNYMDGILGDLVVVPGVALSTDNAAMSAALDTWLQAEFA